MPIYSIDGIIPVIHTTAFVHPTAILIGDVIIGAGCYVGPAASLRGDFGRLVLEEGANIQDTCVMHGFPDTDTTVEKNGHIGHGAVLHGCRVKANALVGMNAVVMDYAVINENCFVAASSFVKAKFECPPNSLIGGVPAKVMRELTDKEMIWKSQATASYQHLAIRSANSMKLVEPLSEPESERKRITAHDLKPLSATER